MNTGFCAVSIVDGMESQPPNPDGDAEKVFGAPKKFSYLAPLPISEKGATATVVNRRSNERLTQSNV